MNADSTSSAEQALTVSELQDLCARLKLEAQVHAQEARTQRATVHEIYQVLTGATGKPGDWNGADPARAFVQALIDCAKKPGYRGVYDALEMARIATKRTGQK